MLPNDFAHAKTSKHSFAKMLSSKRKKLSRLTFYAATAVITCGGVVGFTLYNKPHRNVRSVTPININAIDLATQYDSSEANANICYLDKVLEVNGEVGEISMNQKGETVISLKGTDFNSVRCTMEGVSTRSLRVGTRTSIKGICTGYLSDVILVRCISLVK